MRPMSDMNEPLAVESNEFTDRPELVQKRARTILVQRSLIVVVFILHSMVLAVLTYDSYNGIADRERLLDCTTQGGECFMEGQERTGRLIQQLIEADTNQERITREVVTLAAYCANRSEQVTVEQIEACVKSGLEK